jgi:hypothetical protein
MHIVALGKPILEIQSSYQGEAEEFLVRNMEHAVRTMCVGARTILARQIEACSSTVGSQAQCTRVEKASEQCDLQRWKGSVTSPRRLSTLHGDWFLATDQLSLVPDCRVHGELYDGRISL